MERVRRKREGRILYNYILISIYICVCIRRKELHAILVNVENSLSECNTPS